MKITKQQFLTKLKNAPYSDSLISKWMKSFKDDEMCNQYLQAIELNNQCWDEYKEDGVDVGKYVDSVYNHYRNVQDLPHTLVIPILIGSCDEISDFFLAKEAFRSITKISL